MFANTTGNGVTSSTTTIGTIGAMTLGNATASSSSTTGTLILSSSGAGLGVNGKIYSADNVVIGPSQTRTLDTKLTMQGTELNIAGPHVMVYTSYTSCQYLAN